METYNLDVFLSHELRFGMNYPHTFQISICCICLLSRVSMIAPRYMTTQKVISTLLFFCICLDWEGTSFGMQKSRCGPSTNLSFQSSVFSLLLLNYTKLAPLKVICENVSQINRCFSTMKIHS